MRAARFMATGVLSMIPKHERRSCGQRCPICSGAWHKDFLPIYKHELIRFFESSIGRALLPCVIEKNSSIGDIIWGKAYWVESIFDRAMSGIKKRNVDSVFLSLAAARLIQIKRVNDTVQRWELVWLDQDTPAYSRDENWEGVNLFDPSKPRSRIPTTETKTK